MNDYVNNTTILNHKRPRNQNDVVDYYDIVKKRKETIIQNSFNINRKRKLDNLHPTIDDNTKANNVKCIEYKTQLTPNMSYEYDPIKLVYL